MRLARLISQLARPIRLLDKRSPGIERLLQTPLSETDIESIHEACKLGGRRLGEYYHWYLQKLLVSRSIRNIGRIAALRLIASVDATDYTQLARITGQGQGVLIAVPHHGHYIFSIIHLAEQLRHRRNVYVFYGQPSTHRGNEVFDSLHSVLWGDGDNVQIIHDTRQGMTTAIRALKNGDLVIIMPDVFKQESATLAIPFLGRPMNVMLGTATLARKTGAWILPAVATQNGQGMGFRTWFGERIDGGSNPETVASAEHARFVDYRATRRLFSQYEPIMASEAIFWQFVRQHMSQSEGYRPIDRVALASLVQSLAEDPLLLGPSQVVDLRRPEASAA